MIIRKVIFKRTFEQRPEKQGVESYRKNILDTENMTYKGQEMRIRTRQKTERVKGTWQKMSLGWQGRVKAWKALRAMENLRILFSMNLL